MKGLEKLSQQNLGDSLASAKILQHENAKIEKTATELRDNALKTVSRVSEQLKADAYEMLSECEDFLKTVKTKGLLLPISVSFFSLAEAVLSRLDEIEVHLTTDDIYLTSKVLQYSQLATNIEEITCTVIKEGKYLIDRGRSLEHGVQGILRKVTELENRKKHLIDLCRARQAEKSERVAAFNHFNKNYELLIKWITDKGKYFLQRNSDMGQSQATGKSFVDKHEIFQNDLLMKGREIDALLDTVPSLVRVEGEDALDIHQKAENLRKQWNELRNSLEKKIRISQRYSSFHKLATKVTQEQDNVECMDNESIVKENSGKASKPNVLITEEIVLSLQKEILQLSGSEKKFVEDAQTVNDVRLNMTLPYSIVRDIVDCVQVRKNMLTTRWSDWENEKCATKATPIQWGDLMKDSHWGIKCAAEFVDKVFPVIPKELNFENQMILQLPQVKTVHHGMEGFQESFQPRIVQLGFVTVIARCDMLLTLFHRTGIGTVLLVM